MHVINSGRFTEARKHAAVERAGVTGGIRSMNTIERNKSPVTRKHGSFKYYRKSKKSNTRSSQDGGGAKQETLADVMNNIFSSLAGMAQENAPRGADVWVDQVTYQPPGSDMPLLENVSMHLRPNTLGLVYGCSGGGKSTLLHVLAGLSKESAGRISFYGHETDHMKSKERLKEAGLVFQFPERHFLGDTLAEELTIAWPTGGPAALAAQQMLSTRVFQVLESVGLRHLPLDVKLDNLSGGYKRRVALAVQLIRQPKLLLLDEPLAGLDWRARHDLVQVLSSLRKECTVLVVSHDLGEISTLVDSSWRMMRGGQLVAD